MLVKATISVCLASASTVFAATTIYSQDFESAASLSSFSLNGADSGSNPDDISSASGNEVGTGGNPNGFLQITHSHNVDPDLDGIPSGSPDTFIQSFFNDLGIDYNAAANPIQSLTFRLDVFVTDPRVDSLFFNIFNVAGGVSRGFTSIPSFNGWQTIEVSGIDQSVVGSSINLTTDTALDFGFGFTSSVDVAAGAEDISIQVDNFEIIVVPEPSTTLLAALSALALLRRRR